MNDQQIFEAISDLTSFDSDNLYKNNQRVLDLLINGTKVQKQTDAGLQYEPVKFIDFEHLEKNSYVAVSQFKVRIIGTDKHIYPDIICFVNGIPVSVIECKSPRAQEPIPKQLIS